MEAGSKTAAEQGRRVTADSFRLLAARLVRKPVTVPPAPAFKIPDLVPGEPENPILAAIDAVSRPQVPDFHPPEAVQPVESLPLETEPPAVEAQLPQPEAALVEESLSAEVEVDPIPLEAEPAEPVELEPPAGEAEIEEEPKSGKSSTPLADRVVEAMMKTVSEVL